MSASGKKKTKPKGKKVSAKKGAKPKVTKTKKVVKPAEVEEEKPKKAAPKVKKEPERKEASQKVVKVERVKFGPAPTAMVEVRHIDSSQERAARGFSFGELTSAGVALNAARREGLALDIRRRSVVGGNVDALKGWLKSAGSSAEPAISKKK